VVRVSLDQEEGEFDEPGNQAGHDADRQAAVGDADDEDRTADGPRGSRSGVSNSEGSCCQRGRRSWLLWREAPPSASANPLKLVTAARPTAVAKRPNASTYKPPATDCLSRFARQAQQERDECSSCFLRSVLTGQVRRKNAGSSPCFQRPPLT